MSTLSTWNLPWPGARNCKDNCDGGELSLVDENSSGDGSKFRLVSSSASFWLSIASWMDFSLRATESNQVAHFTCCRTWSCLECTCCFFMKCVDCIFLCSKINRNIVGTYSLFKVFEDVIRKSSVREFRAWRPKTNTRVQWCVYTTAALPFLYTFHFHVYSVIVLNPWADVAFIFMDHSGILFLFFDKEEENRALLVPVIYSFSAKRE